MQRAFTAPPAAFVSVSKQLGRFPLLLFHARCSSVNMLLKLMWNDSNSSHPSPHPQSCQRCIVLYVHPILSSPIFVPPSAPVHSKHPLLLSCISSISPSTSWFPCSYIRGCLTCTWYVDRRLPRAVQQQREVRPRSERLALHLPVGMERTGMRCSDWNTLLRWQG